MTQTEPWWKKAVIYHIYPRSFSDSTNNGIGDLRGVINRFDYLIDLGIDAIWFSPFFPSPQDDFGYDIADFRSINPEYGNMKDLDELMKIAHENNIKIILDLVLNHTSEQHPWFLESKKSRENKKSDWYVWANGIGRYKKKPPNNWKAIIGGSAWEWSEEREQFYLHQFLPCQPDLNWWNQEVQKEMFDIIHFWLKKGVDGFRLDIIHTLFENKELKNNPRSRRVFPSSESNEFLLQKPLYTQFLPETIDICIKIREIIDSYKPTRMLVGEAVGPPEMIKPLYGKHYEGLNLVFNFNLSTQPFVAKKFQKALERAERVINPPNWPCNAFSNHDNIRMISRLGNDIQRAKLQTMLLLTVRGTPFIYYGEEIGMSQVKVKREDWQDPIAFHKVWGIPLGRLYGRDGCRTPMQWDNSPINAGFSPDILTKPWLPIGEDSETRNVETQSKKENSMLNFTKRLLRVRKNNVALQIGKFKLIKTSKKGILAYKRQYQNEKLIILLNFTNKEKNHTLDVTNYERIFSTHTMDEKITLQKEISIERLEGKIIKEV